MSEDKSREEEQRVARSEDEEPDVEAHRFKARQEDLGEEGGEDEAGMRQRRPTGL
jgi:hypothetical protein